MTDYQRGYLDGYRDRRAHALGISGGLRAGKMEADRLDLAKQVGADPGLVARVMYWLGYLHGRYHARHGVPAPTADHDKIPPGLV
jgi:hypothetical protein